MSGAPTERAFGALTTALTSVWSPPCNGPVTTVFSSALLSCMPQGWSTYWYGDVGFYSPAICPSGYYVACSRYRTSQGPAVQFDETAVQCAPSGFTCVSSFYSNARSTFGTEEAPMIQIRWKESDLSRLQTHPLTPAASSSTSGSTTGPGPAITGGGGTADGQNQGQVGGGGGGGGGGLSAGAIAGIVIGSIAAIAIIVLAIVMILRYRQARLNNNGASGLPGPQPGPPGGPVPGPMPPMGHQSFYVAPDGKNPLVPMGQPPVGQPPFGQPPYGQPQPGQPPFGQPAAFGQPPPTTVFMGPTPPVFAGGSPPIGVTPTPPPPAAMYMGGDKNLHTPSPPPGSTPTLGAPTVVAPSTVSSPQPYSHASYAGTTELPDHMATTAVTQNIPVEMQASWGPAAPSGPVGAGGGEINDLNQRQAAIAAQRQQMMQQLDEEEARIRRRVSEIQGVPPS